MTAETALTRARAVIDAVCPKRVFGAKGRDALERAFAVALLEAQAESVEEFGHLGIADYYRAEAAKARAGEGTRG